MQILFIAGFGPIVRDMTVAQRFYGEALGLPFEGDETYLHTGAVDGSRHFALWRLEDAAESCFGSREWPADVPAPRAWIEFDVEDMAGAVSEMSRRGYRLLVSNRAEPWGQLVSRLLDPDGNLVGLTVTPAMRDELPPPATQAEPA